MSWKKLLRSQLCRFIGVVHEGIPRCGLNHQETAFLFFRYITVNPSCCKLVIECISRKGFEESPVMTNAFFRRFKRGQEQ